MISMLIYIIIYNFYLYEYEDSLDKHHLQKIWLIFIESESQRRGKAQDQPNHQRAPYPSPHLLDPK